VLPPDYPRDPRIFAGVSAFSPTSTPSMAATFGAAFRPMTGLPPGQVWVSSHFNAGDPRLFVSALTGVWSTRVAANGAPTAPRQEITAGAGAVNNQVAVLATPPPSSPAAVLAWTPALAGAAGTAVPPSPSAAIMACSVQAACQTTTTLGAAPGELVISHANPNVVVAHTRTAVAVSEDGGQSFASLPLPTGVTALQSAVPVGATGRPWISVSSAAGSDMVLAFIGNGWRDATGGLALLRTHLADLVTVGGRHVMAVLFDAGYRCQTVDATPWQARCS
jgi:hypothetical protein